MLDIKNINIIYDNKECIRNGNFSAYPYQITGIYGESGTGKSSLLYIIGMLSNQQYQYYYHDKLLNLDDKQQSQFRNEHVSFITQNSLLIETINVEKNIEFYLGQSHIQDTVDDLLDKVKMKDKKYDMPSSLSGGERQRIAIACAIAKDSDIILGDELTASLDEENKSIIMELLKECAKKGKIVILVSHEKKVIEECDRIYKIDHLELILEKESKQEQDLKYKPEKHSNKKIKSFKMFEILFYSNKRNNRRRLIISFIIMAILFMCASMFVQACRTMGEETYSLDDVLNNKILVLSDESGYYQNSLFGYAIREPIYFEPLSNSNLSALREIEHVDEIYNYYIFPELSYSPYASYNTMTLKATRNGQEVARRESDDEYYINDQDYEFSVIPVFQNESAYVDNADGVYISSTLAFYYNLEIGDTLDLKLAVPFAMAKSNTETLSEESDEIYPYYQVECITEMVNYKTKVNGIIEANSTGSPQIYMNYDIMEDMIMEQINRYQNGEIEVFGFEDYYSITDLQPYVKAVFVDQYENVLQVQNNISKISNKIYAYYEYQSVLQLMEQNNEIIRNTQIMLSVTIIIFVICGAVIEIMYLRKYKTTYMMMNLNGYNRKGKYKVIGIHAVWQLLTSMCMGMIVYITASVPDIVTALNLMSYEEVMGYIGETYNIYMAYCAFSKLHLAIFMIFIILVIAIINIAMIIYYDRQDIKLWMRG